MNEQGIMWFYIIFTFAIIGMCIMLGIHYFQYKKTMENKEEKKDLSELLKEADSLLKSSKNLIDECEESRKDIEFLIEQYRTNKRWFSEKPGRVTIEDVIKACYEFGRSRGRLSK